MDRMNKHRYKIILLTLLNIFLLIFFRQKIYAEDEEEIEIIERMPFTEFNEDINQKKQSDEYLSFDVILGINTKIFFEANNEQIRFNYQIDDIYYDKEDHSKKNWHTKIENTNIDYFYIDENSFAFYAEDNGRSFLMFNNINDGEMIIEQLKRNRKKIDILINVDHHQLKPIKHDYLEKAKPKFLFVTRIEEENSGLLRLASNIGAKIFQIESDNYFSIKLDESISVNNKNNQISEKIDNTKGWRTILEESGYQYLYVNERNESAYGWKYSTNGKIYHFDKYGLALQGDHIIDGVLYSFNCNGELENVKDYLLTKIKRGWYKIGGKYYYLDKNQELVYGEKRIGQFTYYFNEDGILEPKWIEKNGKLFCRGIYGKIQTGWVRIGDNWFYALEEGGYQTGWFFDEGQTYYFNNEGEMLTGMQIIGNKSYFFNESGHKLDGWVFSSKNWYFMKKNGGYLTGWQKIKDIWYYLKKDGTMAKGWLIDNDKTYLLNNYGAMVTGWYKVNDVWYYFDESGVMIKNQWINNYYLTDDGSMAVNAWIGKYHVNETGLWDKTSSD